MKKEVKQKLKSYSIAAGAVLSASASKSSVVYTDVNPDQTLNTNGAVYQLDLNNDNIKDFQISIAKTSSSSYSYFNVKIQPLNLNQVGVSSSYYAFALSANAQIDAAMSFRGGSTFALAGKVNYVSGSSTYTFSWGNWQNKTDKYLGLKLKVGANTFYGWARLDVSLDNLQFTVKDYAYENTNNQSILTGAVPADPATTVLATDVGNNGNGSDLQVSFNKAVDENTVSAYRLMVVKSASAGSFNLAAAQAVLSARYTSVIPNGNNVSTTLASNATDVDGDVIVNGQAYRVFVLSKANTAIRTIDGFSLQSNELTLNQFTGINEKMQSALRVYASGKSIFFNLEGVESVCDIRLYDQTGKMRLNQRINPNDRIETNLSRRVYLVQIESEGVVVKKSLFLE